MQSGLELGVYMDASLGRLEGPESALSEGLAAARPCSLSLLTAWSRTSLFYGWCERQDRGPGPDGANFLPPVPGHGDNAGVAIHVGVERREGPMKTTIGPRSGGGLSGSSAGLRKPSH